MSAQQDVTTWPLEDMAAILGGELQLVRPGTPGSPAS